MIKLNSLNNEKEKVLNLIKKSITNKRLELECIIKKDLNSNKNVDLTQFINIIKRIKNKNKFTQQKTNNKLYILFPIDSKYHKIRVIINGQGSISTYCNHENINTILNNVVFEKKTMLNENDKVSIPNYNLKFNLKEEKLLDKDSSIVRELIREWKDIPKIFRLKQHYSYQTNDNQFNIDLSIVKSSAKKEQYLSVSEVMKQDLFHNVIKPREVKTSFSNWWYSISKNKNEKVLVNNVHTFSKSIEESRVFQNLPDYEVEVEYIGNKTIKPLETVKETKLKVESIFKIFFSYIGIVLQSIQNSFYIISNKEKIELVKNMQNMINKIIRTNNRNNFKKIKINNNSLEEAEEENNNEIHDENNNKTRLKNFIKINANNLFFGPLAVDLSYSNITPIMNNTLNEDYINTNNNIRLNYLVTDKADGERNLLVINDKGRCYGITRNNEIKYFGLSIPKFANSVFDIEYITKNIQGKLVNNIYIFDCYVCEGKFVMDKAFLWKKEGGRHHCLEKINKYMQNSEEVINDDNKFPTRIFIKTYYPSDNQKTLNTTDKPQIFSSCNQLLNKMNVKYGGFMEHGHDFSYPTDGLIFLPNNLAIYQETKKDNIYNPFVSKSWYMNYKWKNYRDLTIDFKVQIHKNIETKSINYVYFNNKKYVQLNLISKVYQNSPPNQLNFYLLNQGLKVSNIPEDYIFKPSYPFKGYIDDNNEIVNTAGLCYLEVDTNNNIFCENRDLIIDNSVVEFRYEHNNEEEFKWIPVRNRVNYNSFNISSDIWNLIHNPIKKEYISVDHKQLENNELIPYYSGNMHRNYISQPLKDFSNYVKDYLIDRILSGFNKPFIMDLACGKMGDFFKYVKYGGYFLVGIDINPDNLHNKIDGASSRIYNNMYKNPYISKLANKTILINGDVGKNIMNGDASLDILNKYYLDILYGRVKSNNNKLNKLNNMASEGFHLISCMYSIHYMMNDEETLNTFLLNVSENLRDQGYFIGTCLDGNDLIKMFKGTNEIIGKVDKTLIYKVNKVEDVDYDELTVGNKVNMYFETFNNMMEENLVDINYLSNKAEEYNLKLIESNKFLEEPGNLLQQYKNKNEDFYNIINESNDLLEWASINRYFIFQKVNNLNE